METLLKFLDGKLKSTNIHSSDELALPCVLQLNFLQTLIEDKQLLSAITIYLEDVCFVCLQFMRAKDFLIRSHSKCTYKIVYNFSNKILTIKIQIEKLKTKLKTLEKI